MMHFTLSEPMHLAYLHHNVFLPLFRMLSQPTNMYMLIPAMSYQSPIGIATARKQYCVHYSQWNGSCRSSVLC